MALQPQAALEQALRDVIRSALGYTAAQCDRTHNGQPHPRAGQVFVAVWYDGQRTSQSRTCLDEVHGAYVTVTVRCTQPFDRWLVHRDELEVRCNAVRALIHKDTYDFRICRAAAALASLDDGVTTSATNPVGYREALWYQSLDPIMEVGPDWFHAHTDTAGDQCGLAQRIRCGGARRIQNLATMS